MKDTIRNEIRQYFALRSGNSAYVIDSVGKDYPAWVIRKNGRFGVCVLYDGEDVYEAFAGATLHNEILNIEKYGDQNVLLLTSDNNHLRDEFSVICEDFVIAGDRGKKRLSITANPLRWWEKWKALLGDAESSKMVFDVVGELWAVIKLFELGKKPYWSAAKLNSHDIELLDGAEESYEVKSTLNKTVSVIHVSSQFQFKSEKPLYLVFTRLEESEIGLCIDDLIEIIKKKDPHRIVEYENYLESHGFGKGNHYRKRKYVILERNKYIVDDSFPRITDDSFKGNMIPQGITHLEYTVSLDGLPHENWK